jgi:hypothetical protein
MGKSRFCFENEIFADYCLYQKQLGGFGHLEEKWISAVRFDLAKKQKAFNFTITRNLGNLLTPKLGPVEKRSQSR